MLHQESDWQISCHEKLLHAGKEFPIILAYAVTIHERHGLSLDRAIVDLPGRIFTYVMSYVAPSRMRSLHCLKDALILSSNPHAQSG